MKRKKPYRTNNRKTRTTSIIVSYKATARNRTLEPVGDSMAFSD